MNECEVVIIDDPEKVSYEDDDKWEMAVRIWWRSYVEARLSELPGRLEE